MLFFFIYAKFVNTQTDCSEIASVLVGPSASFVSGVLLFFWNLRFSGKLNEIQDDCHWPLCAKNVISNSKFVDEIKFPSFKFPSFKNLS